MKRLIWPVCVVAVACGSDASSETVTVLAASSLTGAFTEVAEEFEGQNSDVDVQLGFAASSALVAQLVAGAPADVVAVADEESLQPLVAAELLAGSPVLIASNKLAVIVSATLTNEVNSLADLTRPDLKVVICAPEVPCGRHAREALDLASIHVNPVSFEENVRSVAGKVELGEADAGIVYATDLLDIGHGFVIPPEYNVVVRYPMALLAGSGNNQLAMSFLDFVLGAPGQAILADHGFGEP